MNGNRDRRGGGRRPPTHGRRWLAAAILTSSLVGCTDSPAGPGPGTAVDLAAPWEMASPSVVDMDAATLASAAVRAASMSRIRSLLVARRGRLVLEEYFGDVSTGSLVDVRSVTKSVVSLLVGIALERGDLPDIDARALDFLSLPPRAPGQDEVTVRQLLSMTGGFEWDEISPGAVGLYNEWVQSEDPVGFLLARGMSDEPGERFVYNSAAVHLLGRVLESATGTPLPAYARAVLFEPLGIRDVQWETLRDGTVNGGSGLDMRPRDLARLGQLVLQRGWSGDAQVVPAPWVDRATRPHISGSVDRPGYGYLWWIDPAVDAAFAWGYAGQFVYVVPSLELVTVVTTEWRNSGEVGGPNALAEAAMDLIVTGVLPAAR